MCSWRTERIRMRTRTYVMSRANMLLSTFWLFWSRGTHSFNVVSDGGEGCALKFSSLLKMLLFTCTVLRVALATALMGEWCGWRHSKNPWTKGKKNSPNSSDLVFCSHRHHGLLIWITEGGRRNCTEVTFAPFHFPHNPCCWWHTYRLTVQHVGWPVYYLCNCHLGGVSGTPNPKPLCSHLRNKAKQEMKCPD